MIVLDRTRLIGQLNLIFLSFFILSKLVGKEAFFYPLKEYKIFFIDLNILKTTKS